MPQSTVADVVAECNGTGTGPYTIWDVGGVTSGQVYDKIKEADAVLRGWVGDGPSDSTVAKVMEQAKRFEVNYASAKLLSSIIGIISTDGFNYSLGGLDVQRFGAKFQTYEAKIKLHLDLAKWYIVMLHEWFMVYSPENALGYTENGTPVTYWNVGGQRY